MFSHDALWYQILQGPIAIIGGIGFGVIWGALSRYVPEKGDVSLGLRLIYITPSYAILPPPLCLFLIARLAAFTSILRA
jgi:hypothetical protein